MRIVWLTGQSGSGKTTLAKMLQNKWPCLMLDGDEMRDSISVGVGFSPEARTEHNFKVARLAREMSRQKNVVVSVIAPLKDVREAISRDMPQVEWVYLKRDMPPREGHFYEEPENYFTLDHNFLSLEDSLALLVKHLDRKRKYSLFIGRWQSEKALHSGHLALFDKIRREGKNILIAIRDTKVDNNNPLTAQQRLVMIQEQVPDAKVIIIPDIEEVVYGRKVGWGIREIRLDKDIEKISGTELRRKDENG